MDSTYTPPSILRLGSLTELTLTKPGENPEGGNNGCQEITGIGKNKTAANTDGNGMAETGCS